MAHVVFGGVVGDICGGDIGSGGGVSVGGVNCWWRWRFWCNCCYCCC